MEKNTRIQFGEVHQAFFNGLGEKGEGAFRAFRLMMAWKPSTNVREPSYELIRKGPRLDQVALHLPLNATKQQVAVLAERAGNELVHLLHEHREQEKCRQAQQVVEDANRQELERQRLRNLLKAQEEARAYEAEARGRRQPRLLQNH